MDDDGFGDFLEQRRAAGTSQSQTPEELLADQQKWQRSLKLSEPTNGLKGTATEDERLYFYHLSKKGEGFSPEVRRHIWLQVTGAQGLLNVSLAQQNADYMSLISLFD